MPTARGAGSRSTSIHNAKAGASTPTGQPVPERARSALWDSRIWGAVNELAAGNGRGEDDRWNGDHWTRPARRRLGRVPRRRRPGRPGQSRRGGRQVRMANLAVDEGDPAFERSAACTGAARIELTHASAADRQGEERAPRLVAGEVEPAELEHQGECRLARPRKVMRGSR